MTEEDDRDGAEVYADTEGAGAPGFGDAPSGSSIDDRLLQRDLKARMFGSVAPVEIGGYVVSHRLGAGGMGVVYAARDPRLERDVALKVVLSGHERGQERMLREARALAKLTHPNVVTIHEVDLHDGQLFVAMELVAGVTLRTWLETSRSPQEIAGVFLQAAEGLAAAHRAGLVHRDFKPDNVLIGEDPKGAHGFGRVRVVDFGLARAAGSEDVLPAAAGTAVATITRTGETLGTPAYMALEQLTGREVDARTDIFAFSVALYEALHGRRPYPQETIGALLIALREGPRSSPFRRDLPRRLARLLRRGLATDPSDRPATLDAFIVELRRVTSPPRRLAITIVASIVIFLVSLVAVTRLFLALFVLEEQPDATAADDAPLPRAEDHLCPADAPPDERSCEELADTLLKPAGAEDWATRCAYRRQCAAPNPECPLGTHWDGTLGCALEPCAAKSDDEAIAWCERGEASCCVRAATARYTALTSEDDPQRERIARDLARACAADDAYACGDLATIARRFEHDERSALAALVTSCQLGYVRSCRRIAILVEEREGLRPECTLDGENCDGVEDSPVQLAHFAACRAIEWEVPALLDDDAHRLGQAFAAEGLALAAGEAEAIDRAEASVRAQVTAEHRTLWDALVGTDELADLGTAEVAERLRTEVHARHDVAAMGRAHQRLADARAGITPARTDKREDVLDRWLRLESSIASRIERVLGESLGADRAAELHGPAGSGRGPRCIGCKVAARIDSLVALATDGELLEAWRRGDAAAGEALFDRHFGAITRFFRNKVGDGLDDLVQTTFMTLLEAPDGFRGEGSFRAYLFGVAYNVLRRHFRERKRDERIDFGVTSVHAAGAPASAILEARREHRRLLQALRRIPIEHQTLLELYYWESLSASAIAAVLGVPEGTVRTRLRRARALLQDELARMIADKEVLATTLARLDDWARSIRDGFDR